MSERMRTILAAIGILVTATVLGFLIWYFFFRAPMQPTVPTPTTPGQIGQLPTAGEGGPGRVTPGGPGAFPTGVPALPTFTGGRQITTETVTTNPVANLTGTGSAAAFYDPTTGQFSKIDANGNLVKLSDKTFFEVQNVTWAPNADKAILEFPDQSKIVYNFTTDTQVTLPKHWQDFNFSTDGGKIAGKSIGQLEESRWLFVANADGTQQQAIQPLGVNGDKVDVSWAPNNQVVAFARTGTPRDGESQEIIPLGMNNENFKSLVVPGFGFRPNWSPDGNTLLYSVYNTASGNRPELYITTGGADAMGENRQSLRIQTWADKCSFQGSSVLFCAVPSNLEPGVGIIPEAATNTNDGIYRIDLSTGIQELVVPPSASSISSITAAADGRSLYYTDAQTGRLHKVSM